MVSVLKQKISSIIRLFSNLILENNLPQQSELGLKIFGAFNEKSNNNEKMDSRLLVLVAQTCSSSEF